MIFDDDLALAESVRAGLAAHYHVAVARDLYHLIDLLSAGCQLLILDLNLKGYTGADVFEAIRKDFGDTRVLLFTGCADEMHEDLEAARKAGLQQVLCKPATLDELKDAIDRTLNSDA